MDHQQQQKHHHHHHHHAQQPSSSSTSSSSLHHHLVGAQEDAVEQAGGGDLLVDCRHPCSRHISSIIHPEQDNYYNDDEKKNDDGDDDLFHRHQQRYFTSFYPTDEELDENDDIDECDLNETTHPQFSSSFPSWGRSTCTTSTPTRIKSYPHDDASSSFPACPSSPCPRSITPSNASPSSRQGSNKSSAVHCCHVKRGGGEGGVRVGNNVHNNNNNIDMNRSRHDANTDTDTDDEPVSYPLHYYPQLADDDNLDDEFCHDNVTQTTVASSTVVATILTTTTTTTITPSPSPPTALQYQGTITPIHSSSRPSTSSSSHGEQQETAVAAAAAANVVTPPPPSNHRPLDHERHDEHEDHHHHHHHYSTLILPPMINKTTTTASIVGPQVVVQPDPPGALSPLFCQAPAATPSRIRQQQQEHQQQQQQQHLVEDARFSTMSSPLQPQQQQDPDESFEIVCVPTKSLKDDDDDGASSSSSSSSDDDAGSSDGTSSDEYDKYYNSILGMDGDDYNASFRAASFCSSEEDDLLVEILDTDDNIDGNDDDDDDNHNNTDNAIVNLSASFYDSDISEENLVLINYDDNVEQSPQDRSSSNKQRKQRPSRSKRRQRRQQQQQEQPVVVGSNNDGYFYDDDDDEADNYDDDFDNLRHENNDMDRTITHYSSERSMMTEMMNNKISNKMMMMMLDDSIFVLSKQSQHYLAMQTIQEFCLAWIYQYRARCKYQNIRHATILLQRIWRGWKQRQAYHIALIIMHTLATRIQRAFQNYHYRHCHQQQQQQAGSSILLLLKQQQEGNDDKDDAIRIQQASSFPTTISNTVMQKDEQDDNDNDKEPESNDNHDNDNYNKSGSSGSSNGDSASSDDRLHPLQPLTVVVAYSLSSRESDFDNDIQHQQQQQRPVIVISEQQNQQQQHKEEMVDLEQRQVPIQYRVEQQDKLVHAVGWLRQQNQQEPNPMLYDTECYIDPTLKVLRAASHSLVRQVDAAIVLQHWWTTYRRGYLCRCQWIRQRCAILTLQRCIRTWYSSNWEPYHYSSAGSKRQTLEEPHHSPKKSLHLGLSLTPPRSDDETNVPPAPPPSSAYTCTARVDALPLAAERLSLELQQIVEEKKIVSRLQQEAASRSLKMYNNNAWGREGESVIIVRQDDDSEMTESSSLPSCPLSKDVQQQRDQYKARHKAARVIQMHVRGFICRFRYKKQIRRQVPPQLEIEPDSGGKRGEETLPPQSFLCYWNHEQQPGCPEDAAEACKHGVGQCFGSVPRKSQSSNSTIALKSKLSPLSNTKNHCSLSPFMTSPVPVAGAGAASRRLIDEQVANVLADMIHTPTSFSMDSDDELHTELQHLPQSEDTLRRQLEIIAELAFDQSDLTVNEIDVMADGDNSILATPESVDIDQGATSQLAEMHQSKLLLPMLCSPSVPNDDVQELSQYSKKWGSAANPAATTIQAAWRGYYVAATYLRYMAARMIQTEWRRFVKSILYRFNLLNIILVQSAWRAKIARKVTRQRLGQHWDTSARKIQVVWRCHDAQGRFVAATRLQAKWRAHYMSLAYRLYVAARNIQTSWRCFVKARSYRRHAGARTIQTAWRRFEKCNRFCVDRLCIVFVQRLWRARLHRLCVSSTTIQAAWRCHVHMTVYREYVAARRIQALCRSISVFLRYRQHVAARKIQTTWRTHHRCHQAAILAARVIQAPWRDHVTRVAHCEYRAACSIQSAWRGFDKFSRFQLDKLNVLYVQRLWRTRVAAQRVHQMRQHLRHVGSSWARNRGIRSTRREMVSQHSKSKTIQATAIIQNTRCMQDPSRAFQQNKAALSIQRAWRRYTATKKIQTIWHEFVLLLAYRRYKEMRRHKDLPPFFHQEHAARSIQGTWRGYYIRSTMERHQSAERIQKHPSKRSIAARKIQTAWRRSYFSRWCQSLLVAVYDSQHDSPLIEWSGTVSLNLLRDIAFDLSFEDDTSLSTLSASGKVDVTIDSASTDEGQKKPTWDANKKFSLSVILAVIVPTLLYSSARG